MSKIHITLVGGQTAPVYLGVMYANPDRVVLIHSDQTTDEANRIYAEMSVDCELRKFHPVDLNRIEGKIAKCVQDFKHYDEITINIGGGTKPWSLLFYEHFQQLENAQLFFVDQNNGVWNLKNKSFERVEFDMDRHFRLYGNTLTTYQNYSDYTSEDVSVISTIRELRAFNFLDFSELTSTLYKYSHLTMHETKLMSKLEWDKEQSLFRISLFNNRGQQMTKVLKTPNIRSVLLNTGWFELEVAVLLSKWERVTEMRMNCIFPALQGGPKNEVDIIVNTGTKLLFVECKTQIKNETDIDKFSAAVKNYGGLGSKALFVTDAPMTEKAKEKCSDNGILMFSLQQSIWGVSVEKSLFMLLESELFNINAK